MFNSRLPCSRAPSQVQHTRTVSIAFLRPQASWPDASLCVSATARITGACSRNRYSPSAAAASGSNSTASDTRHHSTLRQRRRRSASSVAVRQLPPLVPPQQSQGQGTRLSNAGNSAIEQPARMPRLLIPLTPQPAQHTRISQLQQQQQQQQQQGDTASGLNDASSPIQHQRQRRRSRRPTANANTHAAPHSITELQHQQQEQQEQQQQQQQQTKLSTSLPTASPAATTAVVEAAAATSAASSQQPASPVQAAAATAHTATAAPAKPSWALAVDRRVAALPSTNLSTRSTTRSARSIRWSRCTNPSPLQPAPAAAVATYSSMADRSAGDRASSTMGYTSDTPALNSSSSSSSTPARFVSGGKAVLQGPPGMLSTSSWEELMPNGELSAEGEQQLCLAYQRYMQLQQALAIQPYEMQQLLQGDVQSKLQAQADYQQQQQQQGADTAAPARPSQAADLDSLFQDPVRVQQEGLLAQELLLQCFEPMLINRAKRVHSPHADFRELLAAARLGLLRAAARYDPQRVAVGKARLYALANHYIRTALRDMLTEYETAPVHVPTHVRELGTKLRRIQWQLQVQRQQPSGSSISLEELAVAAGVTVTQAQWALHATGGALQAVSFQSGESKEKEDRGKAGSRVDLQQMDVSSEGDNSELSGVVGAGGLTAARSGLSTELDAAAERVVVENLLQGLLDRLSPQDRHLLELKLEGGSIAAAARELGKSSEWGSQAVKKVVARLREGVRQHAEADAEVAAVLSSY